MSEYTPQIIDPPVTPLSPPGEIEQWITELKKMAQTSEVKLCLEQANDWLRWANERDN